MIDAATPTPEPFNGLYDFGEAAEPTSGLLPESHSGAEAPILLDWDFIDVFTAADNPSAITSSAGELDFAAAGPIHSVGGWMDLSCLGSLFSLARISVMPVQSTLA